MKDFCFLPILGFTGSGKTELLERLERDGEQVISIEQMVGVRGVCLRNLFEPLAFDSTLELVLRERLVSFDSSRIVWVEWKPEEALGMALPTWFSKAIYEHPAWVILESRSARVSRLVSQYEGLASHLEDYVVEGFASSRRLDAQAVTRLRNLARNGGPSAVANFLVTEYFDPMYADEIRRFQSLAWGRPCEAQGLRRFYGTFAHRATMLDCECILSEIG